MYLGRATRAEETNTDALRIHLDCVSSQSSRLSLQRESHSSDPIAAMAKCPRQTVKRVFRKRQPSHRLSSNADLLVYPPRIPAQYAMCVQPLSLELGLSLCADCQTRAPRC